MILSQLQRRVVEYFESPLIVLAGPGTGKTRVIVEKICFCVEHLHFEPSGILALTFSRRAAEEMLQRLELRLGNLEDMPVVSTIHAFAAEILREDASVVGLNTSVGIVDDLQAAVVARSLLPLFSANRTVNISAPDESLQAMLKFISRAKDEGALPEDLEALARKKLAAIKANLDSGQEAHAFGVEIEWCEILQELAENYITLDNEYRRRNLVDFGDLILLSLKILTTSPMILRKWQHRFKYILVDEFQDSNFSQIELIHKLSTGNNIAVVGDDDQSIYRFRGASFAAFRHFSSLFEDAVEMFLDETYRFASPIRDFSQVFIQNNASSRYNPEKQLKTLREGNSPVTLFINPDFETEARTVVSTIENLVRNGSCKYADCAILYRSHNHGKLLHDYCRQRKIPHVIHGQDDLLQTDEIRMVLSCLEFVSNPDDSRFLFSLINRNLCPIDLGQMQELYNAKKIAERERGQRLSYFEALRLMVTGSSHGEPGVPDGCLSSSAQMERLKCFVQATFELFKRAQSEPAHLIIFDILDLFGVFKKILTSDMVGAASAFERVNAFCTFARRFCEQNPDCCLVSDLLALVAMRSRSGIGLQLGSYRNPSAEETLDGVCLMTVHAAKGLEFKNVFVVSLVGRRFPVQPRSERFPFPQELSKEDVWSGNSLLEEERRLFYVAATRACDNLYLSAVSQTGVKPSRFVTSDIEAVKSSLRIIECQPSPLDSDTGLGGEIDFADNLPRTEALARMASGVSALVESEDKNVLRSGFVTLQDGIFRFLEIHNDGQDLLEEYMECFGRLGFQRSCLPQTAGEGGEIKTKPATQEPSKKSLRLSYTQINRYQTCPLQYKFGYVYGVPAPPNGIVSFGRIVHTTLEAFYSELMSGIEPREDRMLALFDKTWKGTDFRTDLEEEHWQREGRRYLRNYCRVHAGKWKMPLAIEKPFVFKVGRHRVSGKIDKIEAFEADPNRVDIVDYKTGNPKSPDQKKHQAEADKSLQMSIYAIAVQETLNLKVERLSFYYLANNEKLATTRDEAQLKQTKEEILEIANNIERQEFDPKPGFHCQWCDYNRVCDYTQA